jgi:hypothetical protein
VGGQVEVLDRHPVCPDLQRRCDVVGRIERLAVSIDGDVGNPDDEDPTVRVALGERERAPGSRASNFACRSAVLSTSAWVTGAMPQATVSDAATSERV